MKVSTIYISSILLLLLASSTVVQAKLGQRNNRALHSDSTSNDASSSFQLAAGQCEICSKQNKNKPQSITIQYMGTDGQNSQFQNSNYASCNAASFFPSSTTIMTTNKNGLDQTFDVQTGSVFTIDGPFNAETVFSFGADECYFHTSCSVSLVGGDQLGPFKIIGGNDCNIQEGTNTDTIVSTTPPVLLSEQCEICSKENKNKPNKLTLQYQSNGKNSQYQDSSKATCIERMYPTVATIAMANKAGDEQQFDVTDGTIFEISGPFQAETDFFFTAKGNSCFIHTSCSVPLVTGDQIGPFVVLKGNECVYEQAAAVFPAPSTKPSASPSKTPAPSPISTLPPTAGPTPSPPTLGPSLNPTPAPTAGPTPDPTPGPTAGPTPDPTPAPTAGPTPAPTLSPTPAPTADPTLSPTADPTPDPTPGPTTGPTPDPNPGPIAGPTPSPTLSPTTVKPTVSPTAQPTTTKASIAESASPSVSPASCVSVDKAVYSCGEPITVSFNFDESPEDALPDDWIGIYPCEVDEYFHAEIWQWTCGVLPGICTGAVSASSGIVFDSLPSYNSFNSIHQWPVAPFLQPDGSVNRCFKAVLLRNDGPSVPPYVEVCESEGFSIMETPDCPVRTNHYSNVNP